MIKEFNLSKLNKKHRKMYIVTHSDKILYAPIFDKFEKDVKEKVKEFIDELKEFLVIHWTEQDAHFLEEKLNKLAEEKFGELTNHSPQFDASEEIKNGISEGKPEPELSKNPRKSSQAGSDNIGFNHIEGISYPKDVCSKKEYVSKISKECKKFKKKEQGK
jgi:hypothetical protein